MASGSFRRPTRPQTGAESTLFQLHASEYRNPGQLPDGGVLVVGSGQSGCQIAAELNRAGRDVYLSVGRCPSLPFWYRGRTVYEWYVDSGVMDDGVETLPSAAARLACNTTIASSHVPHLVGARRLDYGWIELPIFDEHGWPRQSQGVAQEPGLYFVGLHWLRKRKSAPLFGVVEDAEHVAAAVAGGAGA